MKNKKELAEKEVEKKLLKFFAQILRATGILFLFGFAVTGAVFYFLPRTTGGIVTTIMASAMVVVVLFIMANTEEEW